MATIINKLPASGENALVLNSKEALFYPISFGYNEIRVGAFLSLCNTTDTNGLYAAENVIANSPGAGFYFGLTDASNITNLPYTAGTNFIGCGVCTGVSAFKTPDINTAGLVWDGAALEIFSTIGTLQQTSQNAIPGSVDMTSTAVFVPTPAQATGTTQFANFFGIKFSIQNKGTSTQNFSVQTSYNSTPTDNTSIESLRTNLSNFPNASTNFTGLRYFTPLSLTTGTPLTPPSTVIIYSPFFNNKLRVHNIDVEKYS